MSCLIIICYPTFLFREFMDYGLWIMDYGLWIMEYGLWIMDNGIVKSV
jgi:hypothetical protein